MNLKRTATIVVVGAAVAAWLSAAMTPGVGGGRVSLPPRTSTPVEARGAELANELARFHERLRPDAVPSEPSRNLFTFHAAARRPAAPAPAAPSSDLTVARPTPAEPPLKLAGIAEDSGPEGPVRTAIISSGGQLFLVKAGENVTPRYRVERISADVVELTDLEDGSIHRIALK